MNIFFLAYAHITCLTLTSSHPPKKWKLFSTAFILRIHSSSCLRMTQRGNLLSDRDLIERSRVYLPTLACRAWTLTVNSNISCNYGPISHPFFSAMRKRTLIPFLDTKNTQRSEFSFLLVKQLHRTVSLWLFLMVHFAYFLLK